MPVQLRRRIRSHGGFAAVLALVAVAVLSLSIAPAHWRRGAGVMAAAMLLGAGLRALLPEDRVGLLGVRNRWIDTACYLALGVAILVVDIRLKS